MKKTIVLLLLVCSPVLAQMIGDVVPLRGWRPGAVTVPVALDWKALDAMRDAVIRDDVDGIRELVEQGRIMFLDVGTKVKILTTHGLLGSDAEIRVMEGPYKGDRGFIPIYCLRD